MYDASLGGCVIVFVLDVPYRAWADTSRDSLLAQFNMAPSCRPALFGRTIAYASSPPEEKSWIRRSILLNSPLPNERGLRVND